MAPNLGDYRVFDFDGAGDAWSNYRQCVNYLGQTIEFCETPSLAFDV
jgi:hypothetical protein